jgi:hypothetical protein
MWGALSEERTDLLFTNAADSRQRSHSHVRVQRDSSPHFTTSDSSLPQTGGPGPRIYIHQEQYGSVVPQKLGSFSSLPTTSRATVDVFELASTRGTACVSITAYIYASQNTGFQREVRENFNNNCGKTRK